MALIEGGPEADSLSGSFGNDTIYGFAGDDTLDGSEGSDRLYGGLGHDLLRTGDGRDRAWGGAGDDTLRSAKGDQVLYGGEGDDVVSLGTAAIGSLSAFDPVYVQKGYGGGGNDTIEFIAGMTILAYGGDGIDTARMLFYSSVYDTLTLDMTADDPGYRMLSGQTGSFDSIERLEFFADFGAHEVHGGDLDDIIYVGAGNDWVDAGLGDDTVGYRPDTGHYLDGGAGADHLVLEGMSGQSVYFVVDGTGQVDDGMLSTILNFETYHVFGQGRADDFIALGAGNDSGEGFGGNDSLYGGAGSDRLSGGSGDDGLDGGADGDTLAGGSGNDLVSGDDGNDRLRGSGGSDTLYGGAGADVLNGGAGDDWLSGGDGADRFVFTAGDGGGDLIVDFVSGTDALRFAADLLAGAPGWTGRATAADFAIGSATAAHGQFVLSHVSFANVTELAWDADGTAGSTPLQTLVTLNGIVTVAAEDIWIL